VALNDILLVGAGILLFGAIVALALIRKRDFHQVPQPPPAAADAASERKPEELLRRAYAAFNARDIDGAVSLMHDDVDWPNGMEGGRVHGHGEVRDYWTRQFATIDPHVEPASFAEDEQGRIVVTVDQVVRDLEGNVLSDGRVLHIYAVHDGLIQRMEIGNAEPPADS